MAVNPTAWRSVYSPYINRFLQPDSIIPNPANTQNWNRYAYVLNNPIRYNDPTGHVCSDPEDLWSPGCESKKGTLSKDYTSRWLRSYLETEYGWNVASDFSEDELKVIRQTAQDIESYVDDLTGGMGQEWMNKYLGGTNITQWSNAGGRTLPAWLVGTNTIYIDRRGFDSRLFAHELGHIWDMHTGVTFPWGTVSGVGDSLNTYIGGNIAETLFSRYSNYLGKPADPNIKSNNILGMLEIVQFDPSVVQGYGNGSTADYLAESFAWNVVDRQKTPIVASVWVDQVIIAQAAGLP